MGIYLIVAGLISGLIMMCAVVVAEEYRGSKIAGIADLIVSPLMLALIVFIGSGVVTLILVNT